MPQEWVAGLPEWLLLGLGLGAVFAAVAALAFLAGERLFPTPRQPRQDPTDDARRRAEIRQYLDAIDEQYAEDHFVEGQHVAFYLPERDVAVTFDARAYFRIQRSPTHAVLVEHEMPGVHLGTRLPFETPDLSTDEGGVDPVRAAFALLGLPATASAEDVKAAYREKAKEAHPDHGGDREAFQQIREAYTTAKRNAG